MAGLGGRTNLAHTLLTLNECAAQPTAGSNGSKGERRQPMRMTSVAAVLLAVASAGCFTGPINRPPEVTVTRTDSGPLLRKQEATFQMAVSDPDGDDMSTMTWAVVRDECADDTDPQNWPSPDMRQTTSPQKQILMLVGDSTDAPFCVWAFATDTHNATGAGNLGSHPQNQNPIAEIDFVQPAFATSYPLFTNFHLSGSASSDPEQEALAPPTWSIMLAEPIDHPRALQWRRRVGRLLHRRRPGGLRRLADGQRSRGRDGIQDGAVARGAGSSPLHPALGAELDGSDAVPRLE